MNKNALMIIVVLAVVALIAYFWMSSPGTLPVDSAQSLEVAAQAVANEDLLGTDLTDLDAEFKAIDAELQGL